MKKACFVLVVLTGVLALFLMTFPQGAQGSSASWSIVHPAVVNLETDTIVGTPTISVSFINKILAAYGSPAVGLGSDLYNDGVHFGLDAVYGLAFFLHEDRLGTTGWGAVNHSLGNTRCTAGYACRGGYRSYATWSAGFWDWFSLLKVQYVNTWHLTTVEQIIPVYAPSSDGNNVAGYISAIKAAVSAWRAGRVEVR